MSRGPGYLELRTTLLQSCVDKAGGKWRDVARQFVDPGTEMSPCFFESSGNVTTRKHDRSHTDSGPGLQ